MTIRKERLIIAFLALFIIILLMRDGDEKVPSTEKDHQHTDQLANKPAYSSPIESPQPQQANPYWSGDAPYGRNNLSEDNSYLREEQRWGRNENITPNYGGYRYRDADNADKNTNVRPMRSYPNGYDELQTAPVYPGDEFPMPYGDQQPVEPGYRFRPKETDNSQRWTGNYAQYPRGGSVPPLNWPSTSQNRTYEYRSWGQ